MSIQSNSGTNGFMPTSFVPQFATNPLTGQIFMIAPNQPFFSRLDTSNTQAIRQVADSPIRQLTVSPMRQITDSPIRQITELPIRQIADSPSPPLIRPIAQTKDQTNARIVNIKEKCLSHFIDGQLIIETSRPLSEKRLKKKKQQKQKKKIHQHQPNPISSTPAPANQNISINNINSDVAKIRAEMPNWSVQDVVNFIESHPDIKEYSSKFLEDEMDGKALLLMIDRNLSIPILTSMFKHGPAMKIEATLSRYKASE